MSANVMRATQRLGRLIETIEAECLAFACACAMTETSMRLCPIHGEDQHRGVCHDHDLTDGGQCALATDLREIHAALGGAS